MDPLSEIKVCASHVSHRLRYTRTTSALQVGNDVSIKSLARSVDPDTPTLWYAQDAGGAIWKIDIAVSHTVMLATSLGWLHSSPPGGCYRWLSQLTAVV